METTAKPIVATTSLSFLLHGVVFAGLLLAFDQVTAPDGGVGRGVEIELISSVLISDQQEADVPHRPEMKSEAKPDSSSETMTHAEQKKFAENTLTSPVSTHTIPVIDPVTEPVDKAAVDQSSVMQNSAEQNYNIQQKQLSADESESAADTAQSTNASQQQHAILELLHRRISDNKEYPYLARRQRREGVARVAFVLHPDGKIENTHLVTSSRAAALDRAALTAVKQIEPFTLAQEYLDHAEEFQVDIKFDLL
ncbi:MAG: TonB family protein [Gammaproteobacteria bacterium]